MLPLRFERFWQVANVTLLLLVFLSALVPAAWFWKDTVHLMSWFDHSDKLLHGMTFSVLFVWFAGQFRRPSYWQIAAGLMLFGLLIELCQFEVGYRNADWLDVGANTAGIAIGLAVAAAGLGGWSLRAEDWAARLAGSRD